MAVGCDGLATLPNELYNQVQTFLNLLSIKNLRLTSKLHAAKGLSPAFLTYYEEQETDLTSRSLQRLFHITRHPHLGPAVRRLTVVAVYHDTSDLLARIKRLRDPAPTADQKVIEKRNKEFFTKMGLLQAIMVSRHEQHYQFSDDIVASLSHILETLGSLDVVRLTTRVLRPPLGRPDPTSTSRGVNWNCLWADCHRLLRLVASAMSKSQVEVITFSVFNDCFGKVQSRVLPGLVRDLTKLDFLSHAGSKIKNLSLCFSPATRVPEMLSDITYVHGATMRHLAAVRIPINDASARAEENFPGVAGFLSQTPKLEALELFMYNTLEGPPWVYSNVFSHISKTVRLPNLRRLTLRGIWADPVCILIFLRNHRELTRIDLREVHVTGGTWDPILKHIQSMSKLEELHLENLWCSSEHLLNLMPKNVVFDDGDRVSGRSHPIKNGWMVHTRDISMEELRQGLDFVKSRGSSRGKGSQLLMRWIKKRKADYGPPEEPYVISR
ncbi:hypothetical protein diail_3902 [Diaporthe ilicicola]|nr:hypothetical protein diail_3902 [Diaporthe ilicicola]